MGFLKDVLGFEQFNLKEIGRKVKEDPERLIVGAVDPASSKVWGKVTGKDYQPMVDQWGGASADTYGKAEAAGIDTKAGASMHGLARAIAALYTGRYAAGKLGAGGEGGAADGASGEGGWIDKAGQMGRFMQQAGNGMQQPQHDVDLEQQEVQFGPLPNLYASSKALKQPVVASMQDVIARGARSELPVDSNGVEIAAIQELHKEIAAARARLMELKAKRKG